MKLGEIKLQTLLMMNANGMDDIRAGAGITAASIGEHISSLMQMEAYSDYLIAMPGAINRCFGELENRRVLAALPLMSVTLPIVTQTVGVSRYSISENAPNLYEIERVAYSNAAGIYVRSADFIREGDTLILPAIDPSRESYTLVYRRRINKIGAYSADGEELDVPESIAEFIPYYLKAELYREDEVNEAQAARAIWEQTVSSLLSLTGDVLRESAYTLEV